MCKLQSNYTNEFFYVSWVIKHKGDDQSKYKIQYLFVYNLTVYAYVCTGFQFREVIALPSDLLIIGKNKPIGRKYS